MQFCCVRLAVMAIISLLVSVAASAQAPGALRAFGAQVAPMFEGWYQNDDGTATVLVGFFNPNSSQTVDLPVGVLNRFEPGPEDLGQPTHFPPGRSWGVLSIQVPGDFDGELRWVLPANAQPASMPAAAWAPAATPPSAPSTLFPGLIRGASFRRPQRRPAK